jgi:hypothetical protein
MDQTGHAWHHLDSVLALMIMERNSRPEPDVSMLEVSMPPFEAVLNPEEIRSVIAFIKTLGSAPSALTCISIRAC